MLLHVVVQGCVLSDSDWGGKCEPRVVEHSLGKILNKSCLKHVVKFKDVVKGSKIRLIVMVMR